MVQKALDLLTGLVSIPSLSGQESQASRYLAEWLIQNGAEAQVDEAGNAVGRFGSGRKEILLLGHIDTFPGCIPVRQENNFLYGRGSVDAKGPLCAFAVAAGQTEILPDWHITIVGAVEEEAATSKGARHIVAQRQQSGVTPFCCIIGEPSRWDRITLGYKGRLLMEAMISAPLAHSSGPGKMPAEMGVDFWTTLFGECRTLNAEKGAQAHFDRISPSLRSIQSGEAGCYGYVSLSLGFRLPSWEPPEALKNHLAEWLDSWKPVYLQAPIFETDRSTSPHEDFYPKLHLFLSGEEVCWKGNKSSILVQSFLASIRNNQGQPRFVLKTGTSDLNIVGPAFPAIPIAAYGPGDSTLDHTPYERLDLNEYLRSIEILKEVLKKIMLSSIDN